MSAAAGIVRRLFPRTRIGSGLVGPALITFGFWCLILHASIFQDVGPFPTRTSMAVLQVLAEMVRAEKLLCIVAFAKFVYSGQMLKATVPIRLRVVGKFLAAVAADIMR